MSSTAAALPAPPEVEATLTRLSSHKNVQGVLILSRPLGLILRSSGTLFALPPSAAARETADGGAVDEGEEEGKERELPPAYSEIARRYARAAVGLVESVGGEVRGLKGEGEDEDDLRFLRIRTKRHELMITPDDQYILIVVQDPTH